MLDLLRNLDANRIDLTAAVELSACARSYAAECETLGVETPDWFDPQVKALRREIKSRQQDAIEMRLRSARARLDSLKTADEKRQALQDEIAKLEALATA
jgi:hypothetical protein